MKSIPVKSFIILFFLSNSFTVLSQRHVMDTVQKVMQSIRKELKQHKGIPGMENGIPGLDSGLGSFFDTQGQIDAALKNFTRGLMAAKAAGDLKKLQGGYYTLTKLDSSKGNYKQAYEHYKLYTLYRDSLIKEETERKALQANMQYEFDKKQAVAKAEQDKKDAEQRRIKNEQYFTIAALCILLLVILLVAFIQWRNNNQKKKANALLLQQKEKVEITLTQLRSTQSQLIQAEKMASLGELTAGIAHEIQNPLNFVNNFSEVNTELILEADGEIDKGNISEARAILQDIKDNEQKINHHGKRADAIVKGMLQHSRSGTSANELTNINTLADEYLRLSYHGLRAQDKNFHAAMTTDFDQSIGSVDIVPQDMGRVLLNLFNNAFYAVSEKKKQRPGEYEPTVAVSTKKRNNKVEIKIKDNGIGIPQKVIDKIFQPFFTTKPTGKGTGLGLSLSYEVVKAHGGEITMETKEGEGSEFIITIPV